MKNESYIIHLENDELYHLLSTLGVWQLLSSDETKYKHLVH